MSITYATCVSEGEFEGALFVGKRYPLIAIYEEKKQIYLLGDDGKKRWFPFDCFSLTGEEAPAFEEIVVHEFVPGPFEQSLEAHVLFPSGECRRCWFATPTILAKQSEFIEGTEVWVHYPNQDLILLGKLSEELARQAIYHIHQHGDLMACTQPLEAE